MSVLDQLQREHKDQPAHPAVRRAMLSVQTGTMCWVAWFEPGGPALSTAGRKPARVSPVSGFQVGVGQDSYYDPVTGWSRAGRTFLIPDVNEDCRALADAIAADVRRRQDEARERATDERVYAATVLANMSPEAIMELVPEDVLEQIAGTLRAREREDEAGQG